MTNKPIHIPFSNEQNPNSHFDLLQLEEIFQRENLDHSLEQLHLVEFYIILIIKEGKGFHTIDFTDYECKKGTILTIRKDQIQKFKISNNFKGTLLLFTNDFLVSYLEKLEAQKTLQLFNELLGVPKIQLSNTESDEIFSIIEKINQEYFNINDVYSLGIIRSKLHILITQLFRIKSTQSQFLHHRKYLSDFIAFQELVEKNVIKTLKVKDYAQMMGVSTKTLNTITKSIISKSAKEFVDEICTKQIKRLLINTNQTVKEIAYTSGFEEIPNFYKYFKRQTKLTPEQFRHNFQ